jgi:serine/threonine-protein kinase RsbW
MPTITLPGRFDSLAKISAFVVEAAQAAGLNESAIYAVDLAVDEACSNIIEHAYKGEGKGEIVCTCEVLEDGLKVVLRDTGRPFHPEKISKPNMGAPLKDIQLRGAGLYLIKKMMDEVKFDFDRKTGNTLTMIKRKR